MYKDLGYVTLKTGEKVKAGVVIGPNPEWADLLEKLLCHKGEPWNWQNSQTLRFNLGIAVRYYVLHRAGVPLSNIMISELDGVGFLGHVWTIPEDRKKGACSSLMEILMEDVGSRQGRALFLGTGYDSIAYRIYEKYGFRSIEAQSGSMDWYSTSKDEFESSYFAKGKTEIQPVGWPHWPSSTALFMGDFPGAIRCAPLKLIGRRSTERPFLPLLRDEKRRSKIEKKPRAMALRCIKTTAVVGLAVWDWHPLWADICLVDVFCHPSYWDKGRDLLGSLSLPEARRYIAYSDASCRQKSELLSDEGFRQTTTFKGWVPNSTARTSYLDVTVFEGEIERG